jgi:uncharacterized protein (DUF433 family)
MNNRIISDPTICGGEACISSTRIPVSAILTHLASGESHEDILKSFPRLKKEDLLAALEYTAFLATEKMMPSE